MYTYSRLMMFVLACAALPVQGALRFDGANDYVTFGAAPGLGATNFTIECWFKRQGAGVVASTGSGGFSALPLVTKGRGENEAGVTNMNYFLGLTTSNTLAADFEDKNDGLNHPVIASSPAAASNAWQHAAVTYNVTSSNWVVYLNGLPIATNIVSGAVLVRTPEGNSIQHAALGSALTTAGTPSGYFNGSLEEVRIWNTNRTATQIAANKDLRITSAPGLIGRWPLTETGVTTTAGDTSGNGINGTLLNGPVWTTDSPFAPPGTAGTIGNTNEGTLTDGLWSSGDYINASQFQAASNMTVVTMHAKVTAITGKYKCAIYSESSSLPNRLLRSTAEVSNPGTGWQTFTLTAAQPLTNGSYYWLAIWSDADNAQVYYSDTSGTLRWAQTNYATSWPDPIVTTGGSSSKYCIYARGAAATLVSIAVTPANPTLTAGNSQQFTATGTYSDSSTQNLTSQVTWNSSSTAAATINSSGLATGVAAGTTTISATLGAVSGNTLLTVQPAPLNITTTSLPGGVTNIAYSATLTGIGGTPPYTWALASGSLPAGLTLNTNSGAISGTPTATGISTFTAQVTDNVAATDTSSPLSISIFSSLPPGTNLLFNFANVWRYQQLTNLNATNWKLAGYDDAFWPAGPGVLAYETCGCLPQTIGTTLVTNQNSLAYYFRTHFNFAGNPADVSLVLSNLIDDGAVFYLNGVEIARVNMPAGTITYTTVASTSVSDATSYTVLNIPGALLTSLVAGDNVLAVEVHQINSTSSDIVFGSALYSVPGSITAPGSGGLSFDGVNDQVTFGAAPSLGVTNFTLECWFKRQGAGKRANTGTGGVYAYPLVTKGQGEGEAGATNMNYFLGIGTNSSGQAVLAADFEDVNSGLNHPVRGAGLVASDEWQHGAVTYQQDGTSGTWVLYLNGVPDQTNTFSGANVLATTPQGNSIQHAALGATLRTGGTTNTDSGFFAGTMDEARIWNYARTAQQIADDYNRQVTSGVGLIARWSLDDAVGTTATNSISGGVNGTLANGPVWADGYPFPTGPVNQPPAAPASNSPVNGTTNVSLAPTLSVTVSDPETNDLTVTFYGRVASAGPAGEDFTLVALPDTQFYMSSLNGGLPAIATNQTHWIITNRVSRNIQCVMQLGDCVQNGDNSGNDVEWRNATNSLYRLENPATTLLPEGVPYGVAVGNHDQSPIASATGTTTFYNQYFGTPHFQGYNYYGDHYGANNDNHYDLFSAGAMDFIVLYFEYDATMTTASPVLAWANSVLATNQNRRAIVVSHWIINAGFNATFSAQGQAIYDGLKGNTNLFLMLCGHVSPEEGQRTDTYQGRTVWSVMTDYQSLTAGGNGWLRLYEFSPANNVIHAKTYSPWLNQSRTGAGSQFDIPYAMSPSNPFAVIGSSAGVPSGSSASAPWTNLAPNTQYEWYVTVSDGNTTVPGPVWNFTVGTNPPPVAPTLAVGPMMLANRHFYVGFAGTANTPYTIECATNILGPWETLTNITTDATGLLELEDSTTPAPPMRFYRAVYP